MLDLYKRLLSQSMAPFRHHALNPLPPEGRHAAAHVYELAVWALACPPILYLDMESSVTSHSFMYNTAAHATAPAIHACLFFAFIFDSRFLGFPSARASVLWPLSSQFFGLVHLSASLPKEGKVRYRSCRDLPSLLFSLVIWPFCFVFGHSFTLEGEPVSSASRGHGGDLGPSRVCTSYL